MCDKCTRTETCEECILLHQEDFCDLCGQLPRFHDAEECENIKKDIAYAKRQEDFVNSLLDEKENFLSVNLKEYDNLADSFENFVNEILTKKGLR